MAFSTQHGERFLYIAHGMCKRNIRKRVEIDPKVCVDYLKVFNVKKNYSHESELRVELTLKVVATIIGTYKRHLKRSMYLSNI